MKCDFSPGASIQKGGRAPNRGPLTFWLMALTLAAGSLAGAGCMLRSPEPIAGAQESQSENEAASRQRAKGSPTAVVIGLGLADVQGGVLSLNPTLPGRVVEVAVTANQIVRAGAVLLRLDDKAARARLAEAEAALEAAQAELALARIAPRQHQLLLTQQKAAVAAAEHELAAVRLEASEKEELAKNNLLNPKLVDAAKEQVRKLQDAVKAEQAKLDALALRDPAQDVRRAQANVTARKSLVDQAHDALEEHTLSAPSDGMVLRVVTSPGETLGPQTREPALLFVPDKPRVVRVEVDQEFAGQVAVGQRAEVQDDATNTGPTWRGRLIRVAGWFAARRRIITDTPVFLDVRTLECIVHLDPEPHPPPLVGQRLRVKFFPQ